jgi:hypothetical protein
MIEDVFASRIAQLNSHSRASVGHETNVSGTTAPRLDFAVTYLASTLHYVRQQLGFGGDRYRKGQGG